MAYLGNLGLRMFCLAPAEEIQYSNYGFEFMLLCSGIGYWIEGEETIMLEPGKLLILSRERQGYLRGAKYEKATISAFTINPEWLYGIVSIEEQQRIIQILIDLKLPTVLPEDHPATVAFRAQLYQSQSMDLCSRARALEILALVVRSSLEDESLENSRSVPACACEVRVTRRLSSLSMVELLEVSMENIAEYCGCTTRHARRVFRQIYGSSLREKQKEVRMSQATQLLSHGKLPWASVAKHCGFPDSQRFRAAFRRQFGLTPAEWSYKYG